MAIENRNFRECYYEKVGFKGIEENKIGQLIKENPIDITKLRLFCSKFPSPPTYRRQIWELLAEILPTCPAAQEAVQHEHKLHYQDLKRAAIIIGVWNERQHLSHLFTCIWLIESRKLRFDATKQVHSAPGIYLSAIGRAQLEMFSVAKECESVFYFLTKALWDSHEKYGGIDKLKDLCMYLLERESPKLHGFLTTLDEFPLTKVFYSLFAGYLAISELAKVWDKILSGSYIVVAFVGATTLLAFKGFILAKENGMEPICNCIEDLSDDISQEIVEQALDMWTKKGRPTSLNT